METRTKTKTETKPLTLDWDAAEVDADWLEERGHQAAADLLRKCRAREMAMMAADSRHLWWSLKQGARWPVAHRLPVELSHLTGVLLFCAQKDVTLPDFSLETFKLPDDYSEPAT